jgi:hypothetical protein
VTDDLETRPKEAADRDGAVYACARVEEGGVEEEEGKDAEADVEERDGASGTEEGGGVECGPEDAVDDDVEEEEGQDAETDAEKRNGASGAEERGGVEREPEDEVDEDVEEEEREDERVDDRDVAGAAADKLGAAD